MADWWSVLAMGAGIFGLRFAGFVIPVGALPARWKRALGALPVVMLAALVATSKAGFASGDPARIAGLLAGGVVAWRFKRIWLVIATGLAVFWLTHWLGRMG